MPEDPDGAGWDRRSVLRVALLWLVAVNLRTVVLALAPLLPDIHAQLHLDELEIGLLTTLPVLLFGAGAIAGSAAVSRFGVRRTMVAGCLVVGAASALRGAGGEAALFGGSALLGLAISVMQPALPSVAQAWFGARIGLATTIYGNGFVAGEALAASITLPVVVPLVGGWPQALAAWGLPCLVLGVVFLLPIGEVPAIEGQSDAGWLPDLRDRWTWRLGAFQAGGSALYFGTNAFVPTELHAVGHGSLVTPCLAALNITQLAAAPIVGVLAHFGTRTRPMMAGCGAVAAGGLVLVAFLPGPLAVVGCGVVGVTSAASFVVALALPPIVGRAADVHRLSAGMFLIGYLGAFVLPLVGGFAWDTTGQPRTALLPAVLGAVLIAGALAGTGGRDGADDPVGRLAPITRAARTVVERA
jgi:CP family cyanate transporter-like MFS transporter